MGRDLILYVMFPFLAGILGSGISGLLGSVFNSSAQSSAVEQSKDLSRYNAMLQLNQLRNSGAAQRTALKDLGRSTAFDGSGINLPSTSSATVPAVPPSLDSISSIMGSMSYLPVKKQNVKTGKAEEKLIDTQAGTEVKKQEEIQANIDKLKADTNKANKEADKIVLDSKAQEILNKYLDEQKSAEIRNLNANSEKIDKELNIAFKKLPYEIKEIAAATYAAKAKGNLDSKSIELISSNIRNVDQQTENLKQTWYKIKAEYRNQLIKNGYDFEKLLDCRTEAEIKILEKIMLQNKIPHEQVKNLRYKIGLYNDAVDLVKNALNPLY